MNNMIYLLNKKEYPQVRATNPLYSSQSTIKTHGSNGQAGGVPSSKSSATLVNRRQKFDPQAPRRPTDWRWLAILCIILFFPVGMFDFISVEIRYYFVLSRIIRVCICTSSTNKIS